MGHLVLLLDESAANSRLTLLSLRRGASHRGTSRGRRFVAPEPCGWRRTNGNSRTRGTCVKTCAPAASGEEIAAGDMRRVEPSARRLAGGLRVESDAVVYAPVIAHAISSSSRAGLRPASGPARGCNRRGAITLDNGARMSAAHIGSRRPACQRPPADVPVFARKGHLAITDRYPGLLSISW